MEQKAELAFEVRDRKGRPVQLRADVYERHLPKHPEMADYLEEAKETIADPDLELEDDGSTVYYRMGLGRDEFEKCFVKVPVRYKRTLWGEVGEVATFHLTRRLGRGKIMWRRPRN